MAPQAVETTCRLIAAEVEKLALRSRPPVVLVSPQIRAALKNMTAPHLPQLVVLSYNEITRDTKIESVAMISDAR
jgi:flagellar biosynthesis protein FlhA